MFNVPVFVKDGNRFVVPGFWWDDANPKDTSFNVLFEVMMFSIAANVTKEIECLTFDAEKDGSMELTNIPYRIVGPQFKHGAVDVLLIGGPLFDAELEKKGVTL